MTRNLDVMLSKPGIHFVVGRGGTMIVEVDERDRAFQLKLEPPFERDGELLPGGWTLQSIVGGILGPFARTP